MQRLQPHVSAGAGCQWLRRPTDWSFLASQLPFKSLIQARWATHGTSGRANGPKNGPGKRLGAKKLGDEYVVTGNIIFRQRGTHWYPGENVGMGRDHTIFALQSGYVKYYRDPLKNPKRQYIGVVFDKSHSLPASPNAPRRRRFGMVAVPRRDIGLGIPPAPGLGVTGTLAQSGADIAVAQTPVESSRPALTKRQAKEARKRKKTGRLPASELEIRPDYSFRETNWSIGRAAERAGVKVKLFKRGDRFLAWRKKTVRIARNAEKRAMGKKKGKKDKPGRGGSRATPIRS